MATPELKLEACSKPFERYVAITGLSDPKLEEVARIYERNIERVRRLIFYPPLAIDIAAAGVREETRHTNILKGTWKATKAARKTLKRHDGITITEGWRYLTIGVAHAAVRDGAKAWMAAQITGTWTAFEAMAEDVGCCDKCASTNLGPAFRVKKRKR